MAIKILDGDILSSTCQTLVNTVNCVGVMGAGLALGFKRRYPDMYREYRSMCQSGGMKIGTLWIYRMKDRWVLNFPTKQHWRGKSKEEYLHAGLKSFMDIYLSEGIESIAFPLLGAGLGGLNPGRSQEIMMSYLENCAIPVEIFRGFPTIREREIDDGKTNP
ncbi:macro domain-containing protein [bacterium]|nr:macro domain-containing protein [bacterium]